MSTNSTSKPTYQNPPGTGALFYQTHKTNDRQPDWKGQFELDGQKYEVAAWERVSKAGMNYLSFKVSKAFVRQQAETPQRPASSTPNQQDEVFVDDIPF